MTTVCPMVHPMYSNTGKGTFMRHSTMRFDGAKLELLDQRQLPDTVEYFVAGTYKGVVNAIREMVVRGAPAIGAAAAYGMCLAAREFQDLPPEQFRLRLAEAVRELSGARPTAVNLVWAVRRMEAVALRHCNDISRLVAALAQEADAIAREDVETNRKIARHGNKIVPAKAAILTHCNTGSLATVGWGTALGVVREAHQSGKDIHVWVDETRPRLQGAHLTAFELVEEGIAATLVADSVAATLLRDGKVDLVLVGADRIAANGDTANKIGTFMLSELAARFKVPFYVAAPVSTIDFSLAAGGEIVIEERPATELTHIRGIRVAPEGVEVYNPAFDVTPAENISGIITERGILRPPYARAIARLEEEMK